MGRENPTFDERVSEATRCIRLWSEESGLLQDVAFKELVEAIMEFESVKARKEALEDAAKVCNELQTNATDTDVKIAMGMCAVAIRELKEKE